MRRARFDRHFQIWPLLVVFSGWILLLTPSSSVAVDFEKEIAPLLIRRCLECHKGTEPSGGLSLESVASFAQGGESGDAIDLEQPSRSLLLERVTSGEMPPPLKGESQALPENEQQLLSAWLAAKAPWPTGRTLDLYEVTTDVRGGRDWWAFQPLSRPPVPPTPAAAASDIHNPIDAFILDELDQQGFRFAPAADAGQLVRRMFIDVVGLPPSLEELEHWTARFRDDPTATQQLTERLLDSPHFGERWGRYWLDLVRYAETSGYERDQAKPFAWKYRDWVVEAINNDMPYDEFIRQQIAGDELPETRESTVIATGFLRLGTWNDEPNDDADYQYERLEDMVDATSSAFLGLTVKCARCHDHKFDPIPQADYYRMASAFWPGPIAARDRALLGGPSAEELGFDEVLGWTDLTAEPAPLFVLKNGETDKPLQAITPATLTFSEEQFREFALVPEAKSTQRRLQLAEWIASARNPLTARVHVNRLWQHHFGEGLVRSPNNFGYKGELPTHPELLDWLASELIESGWSAKHIHRLILSSRTWRQSSVHPQAVEYGERDFSNRYWWRANRRRLDADGLRDAMLTASGEIDLRVGGEGFKPTISAEALEGLSRKGDVWQAAPPTEQARRSLYMFVSRSLTQPMMTSFDQPDTTLPCAQRDVTTVAPQALAMLNNEFTHARSAALASRIAKRAAALPEAHSASDVWLAQVDLAWKLSLGRGPSESERRLSDKHLRTQRGHFAAASGDARNSPEIERRALASLCQVLLISNEFLYID